MEFFENLEQLEVIEGIEDGNGVERRETLKDHGQSILDKIFQMTDQQFKERYRMRKDTFHNFARKVFLI